MSDESATNLELSILEIVSQHRDVHLLSIMDQIKQMNIVTGQPFDKNAFMESIEALEKKGYIQRLVTNPDTFGITEKGNKYLET